TINLRPGAQNALIENARTIVPKKDKARQAFGLKSREETIAAGRLAGNPKIHFPWTSLALDDGFFNGLDRYPFRSDEIHRVFNVGFRAAQKDGHDADFVLNAGLADVEGDFRIFARHLPDD